MDSNVRIVRSFKKLKPIAEIPIYKQKHSMPSPASPLYSERHASFSPSVSPGEILHARPSLFSWATNLVTDHVHHKIHVLTAKDDVTHLRASTNGRRLDRVNLVTWEALGRFSIAALCKKYKAHAPVSWYLTESMTAMMESKSTDAWLINVQCYQSTPLLVWLWPRLAASELEAQPHTPPGKGYVKNSFSTRRCIFRLRSA